MRLRLVTPPATEPVSLAEAKAHLRLESAEDDAYVTTLILAARQHVEDVCWRRLVTQEWEAVLEAFPCDGELEMPGGNLQAIVSVTYVDEAGAQQTLAPATYAADTVSVPGRLLLAYGQAWPSTRCQWDAVRVRYTVGWAAAEVPAPIRQALLLLVAQLYEHRVPEVTGTIVSKVSFAVDSLLSPHRLVRL
ncbi:MAG: head-tail connector protein [Myxococcaceae bacterium]|nr:head-tail connector protein [Myxococcaceae bacterium]